VTVYVADSADPCLEDAEEWVAQAGDAELVILREGDGHEWLPGAGLAVAGTLTPRLRELALRSGLDVRLCGPAAAERGYPPSSPADLIAAMKDACCPIAEPALLALFEAARDAEGRSVSFDDAGCIAAALAAGAAAGERPAPAIIPSPPRTHGGLRLLGLRETIEARLAALSLLDRVELGELDEAEAPGLLVLSADADYVDVHRIARVVEPAAQVVLPVRRHSGPGAALALTELGLEERLTELPLDEGTSARAVPRKTGQETIESKHYLSGRHIDEFVDRHGPALTGRVLDYGCGNKPHAASLPNAATLVGVDIEQSSESRVDVLIEPGERLPFGEGWFDAALCTEVLEHVEDPWRLLEEIGRVVRPGGKLIVSAPFVWPLHEEPRDFMRFSPHGLTYLLERAGFEVEVVTRAGGFPSVVNQLHAERLEGGTHELREQIRRLNEEAVARERIDDDGRISTHFPVLATRR
jgi:SAM-dependent methyltransferase